MKIVKKITIILIILFFINFNFVNVVRADDDLQSVTDEASSFVSKGESAAKKLFKDERKRCDRRYN